MAGPDPLLVPDSAGHQIPGPTGPQMTVKIAGRDTGDAYSLIEYRHEPHAAGPPAHVHYEHEEAFYVIDGELTLLVGEKTIAVGAGGMAVVPRGLVHQPSNSSDKPVRFFFISSPAMDGFFEEIGELSRSHTELLTPELLIEIGSRWDSHFVDLTAEPVVMYNEDGQST